MPKARTSPPPLLLRTGEAERLGYSAKTIRELIHQGHLQAVRASERGHLRIPVASVEAYAADRRGSRADAPTAPTPSPGAGASSLGAGAPARAGKDAA
jgi:excisionase family DNA binding protein